MLAKENRLRVPQDFDKVKNKGRIIGGENFSLVLLERHDLMPTRFGTVISKKVSPRAVVRNKVKRAFNEALKTKINLVKEGRDCLFLVKPSIIDKLEGIEMEVAKMLGRANLLK